MTKDHKYLLGTALALGSEALIFLLLLSRKRTFVPNTNNQAPPTPPSPVKPEDQLDAIITGGNSLNNPGGIEKSSDVFEGEIAGNSTTKKSFKNMAYGFRAMMKILRTQYSEGYTLL